MLTSLPSDLRHAVRVLARRPGLTVATLLVLALGLGATASLFSLVNGLLLKELPGVEEPERLVLVGRMQDGDGFDTFGFVEYRDLSAAETLEALVAEYTRDLELRVADGGEAGRWSTGSLVTGNYFQVLGTEAAAGRLLGPVDAQRPGEAPVAVLAHRTARELFGSPQEAVGRTVEANGVPLWVVGVAEEGFRGHETLGRIGLWAPLTMVHQVMPPRRPVDLLADRRVVFLSYFGRLAPGATVDQARSELQAIFARVRSEHPEIYDGREVAVAQGFGMSPGVRSYVRSLSTRLLAVVALVLVIVCANVANLQLARVSDRRLELGVRLALGAKRQTVVRQVLTESLLLSFAGGAAALAVVAWSGNALRLLVEASLLGSIAQDLDLSADGRVLAFAFALALLTGLAAGAAPALLATRTGAEAHLKQGRSPAAGRGGGALVRDGLVVSQIALSLALLVVAALHVRSLDGFRRIDPGFDAGRVWAAGVRVGDGPSPERALPALERLVEVARSVPGVEEAALGRPVPLAGNRMSTIVQVPGWEPPPGEDGFEADLRDVTPGYFRALGLTVLRGRGITAEDGPEAPRVAVVNQTMAERFWPGRDAVGQTIVPGGDDEPYRVVGVVSDMKYLALDEEPRVHFYRPVAQNPSPETVLHVRAAGDPAAVGLQVRRALAERTPDVVVFQARTLAEQLDRSIGTVRVAASLTALFGALALALAAAGLAGTLLYFVRTHLHEIGVRMALGADAPRVVRLVVGRGLRRVVLGLALGAPLALVAADALGEELYGVDPADPLILGAVAAALLSVALAAALPAARRASHAQPAAVLRQE
ncbi:MAG: ADOP family duplicated permease [Thermoanaerobaculia bacterium]